MSPVRILFATAALIIFVAALIVLWPVRTPLLPASKTHNAIAETTPNTLRFQSLAARFDRSDLPEPQPPESQETANAAPPPPDPTEVLQRYRYLGMADADGRGAAVFEYGGDTKLLKQGGQLEGFTLATFDAVSAVFELNGREVRLSLTQRSPQ